MRPIKVPFHKNSVFLHDLCRVWSWWTTAIWRGCKYSSFVTFRADGANTSFWIVSPAIAFRGDVSNLAPGWLVFPQSAYVFCGTCYRTPEVNLFLETFSFNSNVLFCLEKAYRKMSSAFTTFLRGKVSNMPTVPRWNLHRGYRWFRESTPISTVMIRRWVGVMCGICDVMARD